MDRYRRETSEERLVLSHEAEEGLRVEVAKVRHDLRPTCACSNEEGEAVAAPCPHSVKRLRRLRRQQRGARGAPQGGTAMARRPISDRAIGADLRPSRH
eukprot:scaffold235548_cov27-Tisochrysis_lutea.AAC.3